MTGAACPRTPLPPVDRWNPTQGETKDHEQAIRDFFIGFLAAAVMLIGAMAVGNGTAEASTQHLGIGEAKSALGRQLHRSFRPGVETGSMIAYCGHRARHVVSCDVLFTGWDGYAWCGGACIRRLEPLLRARGTSAAATASSSDAVLRLTHGGPRP